MIWVLHGLWRDPNLNLSLRYTLYQVLKAQQFKLQTHLLHIFPPGENYMIFI